MFGYQKIKIMILALIISGNGFESHFPTYFLINKFPHDSAKKKEYISPLINAWCEPTINWSKQCRVVSGYKSVAPVGPQITWQGPLKYSKEKKKRKKKRWDLLSCALSGYISNSF